MGYVIDYYFVKVEREKNFGRHALFVSFFPQLSAGPIARASGLIPQLKDWNRGTGSDLAEGAYIFIRGLFKKISAADSSRYTLIKFSEPGAVRFTGSCDLGRWPSLADIFRLQRIHCHGTGDCEVFRH
jgi:hypothetical protein